VPYSTSISRVIPAPPAAVYAALLDATAVARWRVPDGMTAVVHEFEPVVGGRIRVSLTYDEADATGKTSAHTDTYGGEFIDLVPDSRVVEVTRFETDDPELQGAMTMTTSLTAVAGGTEVTIHHDGVPDAIRPADNELGMLMALEKLSRLLSG